MHRWRTAANFAGAVAFAAALAAAPPADEVVARVGGEPVRRAEVQREFERAFGGKQLAEPAAARLWEETREQVIRRRLALAHLARTGQGASSQDVDLALARLTKDLAAREKKLEDHLQQTGQSQDELRQALAWQIGWTKYLEERLTDENLQKFFDQRRREFDGTRLRVAHVLWKLPDDADEATIASARERAEALRQELAAGKLPFAEAARRHSQAPTAARGGELGWIERRQPMPEAFSRAAFALAVGETSPPVLSPFGLHLIHCLEAEPGQLRWQDARPALRDAVARYLFDFLADREARLTPVERLSPR